MSQKLVSAAAHSAGRATLTLRYHRPVYFEIHLRNISGENGSSAPFMGALEE